MAEGLPVLIRDFPDFQVFETTSWALDSDHLIVGGDIMAEAEQGYWAISETSDLLTTSPRTAPISG